MNWFLNNLPVISSAVVGVGSVLISLVKLFKENDASSRKIKRIVDLSDVYVKLPQGAKAKGDLDEILQIETENFKTILTRKVNISNVAAVIVVSIIGGLMSYLLALWATNSWILWSIIAWILFAVVATFTVGIAMAGIASVYKPDAKKGTK